MYADLLMYIGKEHYTVPQFLKEAQQWGLSRRIAPNAFPVDAVRKGISRVFCWHAEALPITTKKPFVELVQHLFPATWRSLTEQAEQYANQSPLAPDSVLPSYILDVTCALQEKEPAERREIEDEFGIIWQGGVICYAHIAGFQYVCRDGEEDVPSEIKATFGDQIEPVKVQYVESPEFNPLTDEESEEA